MSYDFILLPREPGQSWDEVLDAHEQVVVEGADRPLGSSARARAERIADRLQGHDPQLERFTTERHIELTRPDGTGVQVSLFERELAVTFGVNRATVRESLRALERFGVVTARVGQCTW